MNRSPPAEASEAEGGGFVFGEAVEVDLGERDVERFAGGAGGADPFAEIGRRSGVGVAAGGSELVFGGDGELAEGRAQRGSGDVASEGTGDTIAGFIQGGMDGVVEVLGETPGLKGAPLVDGPEGRVGSRCGIHWAFS